MYYYALLPLFLHNLSLYAHRSNCDDRVKRKLRKLYTPPEFVKLTEADAENLDWVFMGSTGPGAFIHVSMDMTDSLVVY